MTVVPIPWYNVGNTNEKENNTMFGRKAKKQTTEYRAFSQDEEQRLRQIAVSRTVDITHRQNQTAVAYAHTNDLRMKNGL